MRAAIRSFEWDDLRSDRSVDEVVNLVMTIGPLNARGEEIFQIAICTPQAVDALLRRDSIMSGRHLLLVSDFVPAKIEAFLSDRLSRLDGRDWPELADKIGRLALWEFEDYATAND